jgi:hypothetical protein
MRRKYYRLDAEAALRERCLRLVVDIMRIMPCNTYSPMKTADDMYRWVMDYYRENLEKLTLDPYEAMRQQYAPKKEENYDYLAL